MIQPYKSAVSIVMQAYQNSKRQTLCMYVNVSDALNENRLKRMRKTGDEVKDTTQPKSSQVKSSWAKDKMIRFVYATTAAFSI